jgi:hypothetical protein
MATIAAVKPRLQRILRRNPLDNTAKTAVVIRATNKVIVRTRLGRIGKGESADVHQSPGMKTTSTAGMIHKRSGCVGSLLFVVGCSGIGGLYWQGSVLLVRTVGDGCKHEPNDGGRGEARSVHGSSS